MKKSSKPGIIVILMLFIMGTLTVLAYVGIKKKCEVLTKEKVLTDEVLDSKKNRRVNLLAQHQMLIAEDRITSIAIAELQMVKRTLPAVELKVSSEKIERISKVLNDKYE